MAAKSQIQVAIDKLEAEISDRQRALAILRAAMAEKPKRKRRDKVEAVMPGRIREA